MRDGLFFLPQALQKLHGGFQTRNMIGHVAFILRHLVAVVDRRVAPGASRFFLGLFFRPWLGRRLSRVYWWRHRHYSKKKRGGTRTRENFYVGGSVLIVGRNPLAGSCAKTRNAFIWPRSASGSTTACF